MINKEELEQKVKDFGVCEPWQEKLSKLNTEDEIIDFYIRNLEYCFKNNFPDNDYLKQYKSELLTRNIFIDEKINLHNEYNIGCIENTAGSIQSDSLNVCIVHLKDNSKINFICKDQSFNMIYIFPGASINITSFDKSKVIIIDHGGHIECSKKDNSIIKIHKRND